MKKIEALIRKDIAEKIQEAQIFYNLPINIRAKTIIQSMVPMTFEYEEEDEYLALWLTESLVDKYS